MLRLCIGECRHDTQAIQAWMGHKNIQRTVRYTELAPDRFKDFGGISGGWGLPMIDKAGHVAGAAEAVAVFRRYCGTSDEHAIADLICDVGHLADARGSDFLDEVKRGIGHWYAERHASDRDRLGPDAAVEIIMRRAAPPNQSGADSAVARPR
jgi:hypothetical protein